MHISAKTQWKPKIFPSPGGWPYFFPLAPIKRAVNAFLFSRPRSNRKANYELTGADGWRCTKPPRHVLRPALSWTPSLALSRSGARGSQCELSRHMFRTYPAPTAATTYRVDKCSSPSLLPLQNNNIRQAYNCTSQNNWMFYVGMMTKTYKNSQTQH